jgi:hypothetical protein
VPGIRDSGSLLATPLGTLVDMKEAHGPISLC